MLLFLLHCTNIKQALSISTTMTPHFLESSVSIGLLPSSQSTTQGHTLSDYLIFIRICSSSEPWHQHFVHSLTTIFCSSSSVVVLQLPLCHFFNLIKTPDLMNPLIFHHISAFADLSYFSLCFSLIFISLNSLDLVVHHYNHSHKNTSLTVKLSGSKS